MVYVYEGMLEIQFTSNQCHSLEVKFK